MGNPIERFIIQFHSRGLMEWVENNEIENGKKAQKLLKRRKREYPKHTWRLVKETTTREVIG